MADEGRVSLHGGVNASELAGLGLSRNDVLDFSVNVNPYGPDPAMEAAVRGAALDVYPDSRGGDAIATLSSFLDVREDQIILGNGAADLLWSLARLLSPPGTPALMVEPTFSEFRLALASTGARIHNWCATAADGFVFDVTAIARAARDCDARVVYLCNPNNPTGRVLPLAAIMSLANDLRGAILILDEAFLALSTRASDRDIVFPANVIRVRSLTKEHALPGLRVGYAIAPAPVIAALESSRPAWTTSSACQAAAAASVTLEPFVTHSRDRLRHDIAALGVALQSLGLQPLATDTIFVLVPTGLATALRFRLLRDHGIMVRDCTSFGLPEHIRLAARPQADRLRLCAALAACLPG